jgi:hypothetical protein
MLGDRTRAEVFDPDGTRNLVAEITRGALEALNAAISEKFPEAYPGNIFKNQERQAELLEWLLDKQGQNEDPMKSLASSAIPTIAPGMWSRS